MFKGKLKGVSREFSVGFKGIGEKFKGNLLEVTKFFRGSLKGVPRKFLGCF